MLFVNLRLSSVSTWCNDIELLVDFCDGTEPGVRIGIVYFPALWP